MARTVDSIIKDQLGSLLAQVAVLTAEVERLTELVNQKPMAVEPEKAQAEKE